MENSLLEVAISSKRMEQNSYLSAIPISNKYIDVYMCDCALFLPSLKTDVFHLFRSISTLR